jgi:hypothetical protein
MQLVIKTRAPSRSAPSSRPTACFSRTSQSRCVFTTRSSFSHFYSRDLSAQSELPVRIHYCSSLSHYSVSDTHLIPFCKDVTFSFTHPFSFNGFLHVLNTSSHHFRRVSTLPFRVLLRFTTHISTFIFTQSSAHLRWRLSPLLMRSSLYRSLQLLYTSNSPF